jgi:hypothetical protein
VADIITLAGVTPIKRIYPHVSGIGDWAARMSVRMLWDRVFDLEERLQAAEANIKTIAAAVNTINTRVDAVEKIAKQAFALAQTPATSPPLPGDPASGGDPPCPDDGEANAGVADAPGSGHVGVVPLDAYNAGRIIGGTANEFPLLLAPTADDATRDSFMEELLRRMIWHLQLAGFTSGRQRNPSSAISKDKLTIEIGGETVAYDCFTGVDHTQAIPVHADRVCPADYVADPGIAD